MFNGKKTFIAAAGLVLTGISAFMIGEATVIEAIAIILNGLGLAGLRIGIGKI